MRFDFSKWNLRSTCVFCLVLATQASLSSPQLFAQEKTTESKKVQVPGKQLPDKPKEESKEDETDPFAIPDGASVAELFAFINKVKGIQPPKRDLPSVTEHAKKVFPAIIAAADLVIKKSDSDQDVQKALEEKFGAYGILVRYDGSVAPKMTELAEEYSKDQRPAIASIAVGHLLKAKSSSLTKASPEKAAEIVDEVLAYVDRFGITKATYATVSGIAGSMGYTEHTELAATLHEKLFPYFRDSKDETLRDRADMMMGAARRLRLPGNRMELNGLTAAGEKFDWSNHKGKVVLVDFWASWCGPCIGELPNMKKNLAAYGDRGFEIIGINMDDTRAPFEKCVLDKEITWLNLFSEETGKTGWKSPIATYYGITGIPTAILIDREGKVASLKARGIELDKQLERLLGPVEVDSVDKKSGDDKDK